MLNMLESHIVYSCEAIAVLRGLAVAACLSTTFPDPQALAPDILNLFCEPIQFERHASDSTDATNLSSRPNLAIAV